jgi:hypothetical protein
MIGRKIVLSLAVIAGCAAAAWVWDGAVQPQVTSQQALRQMEFHTDGMGSRAAAERRMLSNGLAVPLELAMGVCGLGLVILIWSGRKGVAASSTLPHAHRSALSVPPQLYKTHQNQGEQP